MQNLYPIDSLVVEMRNGIESVMPFGLRAENLKQINWIEWNEIINQNMK